MERAFLRSSPEASCYSAGREDERTLQKEYVRKETRFFYRHVKTILDSGYMSKGDIQGHLISACSDLTGKILPSHCIDFLRGVVCIQQLIEERKASCVPSSLPSDVRSLQKQSEERRKLKCIFSVARNELCESCIESTDSGIDEVQAIIILRNYLRKYAGESESGARKRSRLESGSSSSSESDNDSDSISSSSGSSSDYEYQRSATNRKRERK